MVTPLYRITDLTAFAGTPAGSELAEISTAGTGSFKLPLAVLAEGRATTTVNAGGTHAVANADYGDVLVSTSSAVTITLPDSTLRQGVPISIVDTSGSPNIKITFFGGQLLAGQASLILDVAYGGVTLWPLSAGGWYQKSVPYTGVITPEQFGAVGDDATDNTAAFKALAAYLNTVGGGMVRFRPDAIYRVWPTMPADQDIIFQLNNGLGTINGLTFDFQGATIKSVATWSGSTTNYVFYLDGVNNVRFNDLNWLSTQFQGLSSPTDAFGPQVIVLVNSSHGDTNNIEINNCIMTGALSGLLVSRGPGVTARARNIKVLGCSQTNVFYGLNFAKNGDNVFVRGFYASNPGRVYFPYNVTNHDVEIIDDDRGVIVTSVLIKLYTDNTESNDFNTTSDIKLKYTLANSTGTMAGAALVDFSFQQGTAVSTSGYMRNISLYIDAPLPATVTATSDLISTLKFNFASGTDNVARGYEFENIKISGKLNANSNTTRFADLFNDSTWTGETVRNVILRDVIVESQGNISAIEVNAAPFTGGVLSLENVNCTGSTGAAGNINITNPPAGGVHLEGVASTGSKVSTDITIPKTAVTWGGSGTPAIGNGTLTANYIRSRNQVTVTINWSAGSTTTFGDNSTGWFFALPSPFNNLAEGTNAVGSLYGLSAGSPFTGVVLITNNGGVINFNPIDSAGAAVKAHVPGVFANTDFMTMTVSYSV